MAKRKGVSKQRAWQRAKITQGLCACCGRKRTRYSTLCDACYLSLRAIPRMERAHRTMGEKTTKAKAELTRLLKDRAAKEKAS